MPYSPMKKSCIKMYDKKGKQTGLMMEGSVAHMETMGQEKKNLINDMPIDNRGVCLLYTSPSPRDGLLSRMPSSA